MTPEGCAILADFSDADFSDALAVANIAQAALEDLQGIGRWRHVIFQGTNYPELNPAELDGNAIIPRNEWLAWKEAIKLDGTSPEHLVFGDYGADCAKFEFKKDLRRHSDPALPVHYPRQLACRPRLGCGSS